MSQTNGRGGNPFRRAMFLAIGAIVFIKYGIPLLPGSAPVPLSVVVQYTLIAFAGILVYISTEEDTWRAFKEPIHRTLVEPGRRNMRMGLMAIIPIVVGIAAYNTVRPKVGSAVQLRSIHPAPPARITFQGQSLELATLENPLRSRGNLEDHLAVGRRVYYQNCMPCHGDLLDGSGHFGAGYNPTPLAFDQAGTIDLFTESFIFWRVAKGGPGLSSEGTPWNSAMPVWEDYLTEDEIWSVIIFIYDQAGLNPRAIETDHE